MTVLENDIDDAIEVGGGDVTTQLDPPSTKTTETGDSDESEETNGTDSQGGDSVHQLEAGSNAIDIERAESIADCRRRVIEMVDMFEEPRNGDLVAGRETVVGFGESVARSEMNNSCYPGAMEQSFKNSHGKEYAKHVIKFLQMHGMHDAVEELTQKINLQTPMVENFQELAMSTGDARLNQLESGSIPQALRTVSPAIETRTDSKDPAHPIPSKMRRGTTMVPRPLSFVAPSLTRAKSETVVPGLSLITPGAVAVVGVGADNADPGDRNSRTNLCVAQGDDCDEAASPDHSDGSSNELCQGSEIPPDFRPAQSGGTAVTATAVEEIISVEATRVPFRDDDAEEIKSAKQIQNSRVVFILFCLVILVIVVVGVTVTATADDRRQDFMGGTATPTQAPHATTEVPGLSPTRSPTLAPTYSLESRLGLIREVATSISGDTAIGITNSSQYHAIQWMVEDDPFTNVILDQPDRLLQRYILSLLYFHTSGANWNDQLHFLSEKSECLWFHDLLSACDEEGFLINLELPSNNLVGSLPTEITSLTRLERLDFNENEGIYGTLPQSIGRLSNLRFLGFNRAMLNGSLPEQLYYLTSLEEMFVVDNELTGTISPNVGNLTSLSRFHIGTNLFSGTLPEEIFDLTGMRDFDIRANNFVGTFTGSYQRWTDLESLVTFRNSFNGTLPTVIGTLTQLTNMQISDMALNGNIPSELGNLHQLSRLALSYNEFTGTLPFDFLRLSSLQRLYLQSNDIEGDISFMCVADIGPLEPFRVDLWETTCTCCTCCET